MKIASTGRPPILGNRRGQASILVAIIFQAVFLLFAMVINVGLLVHDKINLQNSADIAAYYGAMKQAEVLNAMAHVNYQVRQAYKLMVWRYWGVASAGNNPEFNGEGPAGGWLGVQGPSVCVRHQMWRETAVKNPGGENLCKRRYTPQITPVTLTPIQSLPVYDFMQIFAQQSQQNADVFNNDFSGTGVDDYNFAMKILSQYKLALAPRRRAMQALEKLLVDPTSGAAPDNFVDLEGQPVKTTVAKTFSNNLTYANSHGGAQISFVNGVFGHPFIVPREARVYLSYIDFQKGGGQVSAVVRDLQHFPVDAGSDLATLEAAFEGFNGPDYSSVLTPTSAQAFIGEDESDPRNLFKSVMTFEKNPWIMVYVGVHAVSHPTLLFSPLLGSGVEIVADSYAMPFGGRIGPWIMSSWDSGMEYSNGGQKIDNLLPHLLEDAFVGNAALPAAAPNYSRYPGDSAGMNDMATRDMGLDSFKSLTGNVSWASDYGLHESIQPPSPDYLPARKPIRDSELLALSPDVFDAVYYSINPYFTAAPKNHPGLKAAERSFLAHQICNLGCFDFGSRANNTDVAEPLNVATDGPSGPGQITAAQGSKLAWKLDSPDQLYTSWTQESSTNFAGPPTSIGKPPQEGGRSGYSVKIVSHDFFYETLPLGGSNNTSGRIVNPP